MSANFVYVTCATAEEAQRIAATVVEEELAACANILPGMTSVYRWKGAIETATEVVLIFKTASKLSGKLTGRVCELHSYECPCVVVLPIESGNPDYMSWIASNGA